MKSLIVRVVLMLVYVAYTLAVPRYMWQDMIPFSVGDLDNQMDLTIPLKRNIAIGRGDYRPGK